MSAGAAISGVGYTEFSNDSGRSVLALAREACAAAIADAGLAPTDVDGVASFMLNDDSVPCLAVATALALPQTRFAVDLSLGGQAPCHLVNLAAQAVRSGHANHVVVFRAMNGRSGARVGAMHFPGLGAEAARWLVEERLVGAVGIDTPSIDHGPSQDFAAHVVLAGAGVPVFENVAATDTLPATGFRIVALPMKIGAGSGAPLRIIALIP